jgi:hypothetical protein
MVTELGIIQRFSNTAKRITAALALHSLTASKNEIGRFAYLDIEVGRHHRGLGPCLVPKAGALQQPLAGADHADAPLSISSRPQALQNKGNR